jgi:hypothetical protein
MRVTRFLGVIAVLVAAVIVGASPGAASQAADFTDPLGDGGGALDIIAVSVSNDALGEVSVFVVFFGFFAPGADMQVTLVLDSDRDRQTGSNGFDYAFQYDALENTHAVGRWDGTRFAIFDAPTAKVDWTASSVLFKINRKDLGGTNGFDFWVRSHLNPPDSDLIDDAPNDGTWAYELTAGAQASRVVLPTLKPRAGKIFDARAARVQLSDGTRVAAERLTCRVTSGGRALKPLAGGCRWRIPARLKARRIVLTIVATYGDAQLRTTKRLLVGR